jgi:hypothetical protein
VSQSYIGPVSLWVEADGHDGFDAPGCNCVANVALHLDAHILQPLPRFKRHVSARQDLVKQILSDFAYSVFDPFGDFRRWVQRINQIIFQIPANIFGILR